MAKDYKQIIIESLKGSKYFNNEDLRINKNYGYLLSNKELEEFLVFKDSFNYKNIKTELPLLTFNSPKIYHFFSKEFNRLCSDYFAYLSNDISIEHSLILSNYEDVILSLLASELEGSLAIESVNTTRKKISEIFTTKKVTNKNEQIILNMYNGYLFIRNKPEFNKENLLKLYRILTKDCLEKEDDFSGYYREGPVFIGNHDGCDVDKIETALDSLFAFINGFADMQLLDRFILPQIAHYYILYIHPYNDYNGRTARMVSFWLSILLDNRIIYPIYISEAINDDKNNYYKAIDFSRNSHNDLTYFLTYLMKLANSYYLVYKNIEAINAKLGAEGESLSSGEKYYLKRIIINSKKGWFNYRGFLLMCNTKMTKQGALKILNKFLSLGYLVSKTNSRNEKVFSLNSECITYSLD